LQSSQTINLPRVKELVIAGWTGRDVAALEKHIRELEAIGVKRPKTTPIFYRVAASLLTSGDAIEVLGDQSSGEAECVVYSLDDGLFVGVGSDHTDRKVETVGVSLSKQMCAKPVSRDVWRLEDVAVHWDKLILRSYVGTDGRRRLYQEGSVAAMRPPTELFKLYCGGLLPAGTAMFCGTLAVHGGIAPSQTFEMELEDPVLGRKITHSYRVKTLPDQG
jgi:Protein of unknown function (DUF2848)